MVSPKIKHYCGTNASHLNLMNFCEGNTNIPGEKGRWNIGTKASYYIDSCAEPWSKHYKMHTYLSEELPKLINENFPVLPDKQSIMGHRLATIGFI